MGARVIVYKPESKCGYTFKEKRGGNKIRVLTPEPYSKLNSYGEEIILTEEEVEDWTKAYHQAIEELGACKYSQDEKVYRRVDEILKENGNYRFL